MARNYHQGVYEVKNKEKYIGTRDPTFRSSYELEFFKWCDRTRAVVEWGSEVVVVPYFNPIKNRKARYFVDIYMKYINKNGDVVTEIIEIKPLSQCMQPKAKKTKSKNTVIQEQIDWTTNNAKWEAATQYASVRGWRFRVITERSIFKS